MIRIFIGYDPRETVAYNVLSHSILSQASEPVAIAPIALKHLSKVHTRARHSLASTEFSFSRFLVPFLCDYEGWAIFMDCDMMLRTDIAELWALRDEQYAVQVVKHEHEPSNDEKFLGNVQTRYQKKNWSSVMLMNCARCKALTPDYVNNASGLELHQFKWLSDEREIGDLPQRWNHLVGYNAFDSDAANVHFTEGGPYFLEYTDCDFADEWELMKQKMLHVDQIEKSVKNVTRISDR